MISPEIREAIQGLKSKLHALIRKSRDVYIHKEKLIPIFTGLKCLYQSLNDENIRKSQEKFEKCDKYVFNGMNSYLADFDYFISRLTASEYLNFISIRPPNQAVEIIFKYCQDFNKNLETFPLLDTQPIQFDEISLLKLNSIDMESIVNRLKGLEQTKEIKNLITSYQGKIEYKAENNDFAITPSDVESYLANFVTFKLNSKDFEVHKKIGSDEYSELYCVHQNSTGKIIEMQKFTSTILSDATFNIFKSEIRTLSLLDHPNLLKFYGFSTDYFYAIYKEYMPSGTLAQLLRNDTHLSTTQLTIIIIGITFGLAYLHDNHIIHQNLSLDTIYMDSDLYPHIGEVGITQDADSFLCVSEKDNVSMFGSILWDIITYGSDVEDHEKSSLVVPRIATLKLCKIIRSCQESNPNLRPTMSQILKNRKDLYLNDIDENIVESYVHRITNPEEYESPNIHSPKDYNLSSLLDEAALPDISSLEALSRIIQFSSDQQWKASLMAEYNIKVIVDILNRCQSPQKAILIFELLSIMFENPNACTILCRMDAVQSLLNIFMKYGTTSSPAILSCLKASIGNADVLLNKRQVEKLSSFLIHNDIQVRTTIMALLLQIIHLKVYENEDVLSVIVPKVIENIVPEMPYSMLSVSIDLLSRLIKSERIFERICRFDGPTAVLQIATVKYQDINKASINFLCAALQKWLISLKFISKFTRSFGDIVSATDEEDLMKVLSLLDIVMKHDTAYAEIGDQPSSKMAFMNLIMAYNDEIRIKSLETVFQFLRNPKSSPDFIFLMPTLFNVMGTFKDDQSAYIALQCLVLIGGNDNCEVSLLNNNVLFNFINQSFDSFNTNLQEASLRMIGLMCSKKECTKFVVDGGFIPKVLKFVHGGFEELQELAYMTIAAFTKSELSYPFVVDIVETILSGEINKSVLQYVLITILNTAVMPECAKLIVPKIAEVFKMTNILKINDTKKISLILVIAEMLLNNSEVRETISHDACDIIMRVVKITRLPELEYQSATVFELLTSTKAAKDVIKDEIAYYEETLKTMEISSPLRPIYLRISTRKM